MDIVLLEYLLRLFALIANLYPNLSFDSVSDFVRSFLLKELSPEIETESLRLFNEYYDAYSSIKESPNRPGHMQVLVQTIENVDKNIPRRQKFNILLRLLLFEKFMLKYQATTPSKQIDFNDILNLVIGNFMIDERETANCKAFISDTLYKIPDKEKLLIVSGQKLTGMGVRSIKREGLNGQLHFLYVESIHALLFMFKGQADILLNNQSVFPNHVYFLNKGFSIKGHGFEAVYYNQVMRSFLTDNQVTLSVSVKEVEYRYPNSNNGIHKANLYFESGQLVGIIGRSGVGKSTLINLLNGKMSPQKGSIRINGHRLEFESKMMDGLIGYIPQDDLLIEELTVFTNLYLNARLCFDNLSKDELIEKVNNILVDLDLYEVRDLKVGSPLNKYISGGQRKKLNIALELIREAWILFADEPTSGLSSSDSEEIMQLLADQTINGRIVVVNIHQPSSDIFKMFDKIIVLDKEGYPVYFGNPMDSIGYFNDYYQRVSKASDLCNVCENINPEAIFKILEEKKINDFGEFTKERKTSPAEWHENYLGKTAVNGHSAEKEALPKIEYNKPGIFKQFKIFSQRNLLSKLSNIQYVLLALLISPVLAFILALLCRYTSITEAGAYKYIFSTNDNIPSFLFMSVLVPLFVGLIISADEIIKDRKILLREEYLKLNKLSYIHSKLFFLLILSGIQTFMYVLISNFVLEIHFMTFRFWAVLFSLSFFSNILGLLISSLFNSVVTIYIMVPLIIVPQILLSGVVVNYRKLNNIVSSREYVPFVGDMVASRWGYEALLVVQFAKNDYQKHFFDIEKQESNVKFALLFIIPELKKAIYEAGTMKKTDPSFQYNLIFIRNVITDLKKTELGVWFDGISPQTINLREIEKRLRKLNTLLPERLDELSHKKDSIAHSLVQQLGSTDRYLDFKNENYNEEVADWVLKRKDLSSFTKIDNRIVREMEPIYQQPLSPLGRATFLSSSKRLGNTEFPTFLFNLSVIWLMSIFLYVVLIFLSIFRGKHKKV
jgi:ABC-type multidrug transport system ATPase subunit